MNKDNISIDFDINGETGHGDSAEYRKIGVATLQTTPGGIRFSLSLTASPVSFRRTLVTPTAGELSAEFSNTYHVLDAAKSNNGSPVTFRVGKLIPVRLATLVVDIAGEDGESEESEEECDDFCFELLGPMGHFWQCGNFIAEADPHALPDFFTVSDKRNDTAA